MGKIDELIKQPCPDGVQLVSLDSVCSFKRGTTITAKKAIPGGIPVVAGGQTPSYYHNEANRNGETIAVAGSGAYAGFVSYWDTPFFLSDAFSVEPCNKVMHKYLFYYLRHNQQKIYALQKGAGVPHVHGSDIAKFKIPLPPLAVQEKIVEILDTFTGMIDNLQKELKQRQKQLEYYRDKLFIFKGNIKNEELGKICSIKGRIGFRGYTKNDFVEFKKGAISLSPGDIKDNQLYFDNCSYISWDKYEQSPEIIVERGDILLCKTGSVGKTAIVQELPWKATINPQFVILKNVELNNKYLFYALCLPCTQIEIKRLAGVGSVPNVSQAKLAKVEIPMPPLETQQEIVDKLDTFEALISNIKQEIELRQKQYEYYREKLLTFE